MAKTLDVAIAEIDALVAQRKLREARGLLSKINVARVPREKLASIAHLARWALAPELALRLLHKTVRPSDRRALVATDYEKSVYVAALNDIGAYQEARSLLGGINTSVRPEALLYQAQLLIREWDWAGAIAPLSELLESTNATEHDRMYSKILLGSAYLYGSDDVSKGQRLLEECVEAARASGDRYFLKNALQLLAQGKYLLGNIAAASKTLSEFETLVNADRDRVFIPTVALWKGILSEDLKLIHKARAMLVEDRLWERVRICDYHEARIKKNKKLILRLYFGSPYEGLRARVLKLLQDEMPESYQWVVGDEKLEKKAPSLDVFQGTTSLKRGSLKRGQLLHRALQALCLDLYKPQRVAEIYQYLFPGQHYNATQSPNRVYKSIRRLRRWLKSTRLPLQIQEADGYYSLQSSKACRLMLRPVSVSKILQSDLADQKLLAYVIQFEKEFAARQFSANDAMAVVEQSYRSTVRILSAAVEKGHLFREGKARATTYRVSKK